MDTKFEKEMQTIKIQIGMRQLHGLPRLPVAGNWSRATIAQWVAKGFTSGKVKSVGDSPLWTSSRGRTLDQHPIWPPLISSNLQKHSQIMDRKKYIIVIHEACSHFMFY